MKSCVPAAVGFAIIASTATYAADGPEILAQWRAAVHARAKQRGETHLVRQGTSDNLPTTIDEWIGADGSYRIRVDRRFDSDEIVLKNGHAQRRDWEGYVRKLDGDERARLVSEAWAARALAFGPSGDGVSAIVKTSDNGCCDVLTLAPPGGAAFDWAIDRKTHLPVNVHKLEGEGDSATVKFEGWSPSPWGTIIPHKITVLDADRVPATYTIASATFRKTMADADFADLLAAPSDVRMQSDAATLPFTFEASHIVIPVSVNGRPSIGFIFDTGDESEALNSARLPSFGVEAYGSTALSGGGEQVQSAFARGINLAFGGGVSLVNQHAVTVDDTGLEHALGVANGGILGYDFISRFVVEIDYRKKLITLHNPRTWQYRGSGTIVPITFDDGIPYVEAHIAIPRHADLPAHMVADFGAAETMTFTAPFVEANNLRALIGTNAAVNRYTGLDKEYFAQANSRGLLPELRLGALVERNIPVNLSANTTGAYGTGQFAGTIGETLYSRYRMFIDYPHNRLIFEPTVETAKPFEGRKTFGLTLIAAGDDLHSFVVTAVRQDSPAAKAGFQPKDEITAVDAKPASTFDLADLRSELAADGKAETIAVKRGGAIIEIRTTIALVSVEH